MSDTIKRNSTAWWKLYRLKRKRRSLANLRLGNSCTCWYHSCKRSRNIGSEAARSNDCAYSHHFNIESVENAEALGPTSTDGLSTVERVADLHENAEHGCDSIYVEVCDMEEEHNSHIVTQRRTCDTSADRVGSVEEMLHTYDSIQLEEESDMEENIEASTTDGLSNLERVADLHENAEHGYDSIYLEVCDIEEEHNSPGVTQRRKCDTSPDRVGSVEEMLQTYDSIQLEEEGDMEVIHENNRCDFDAMLSKNQCNYDFLLPDSEEHSEDDIMDAAEEDFHSDAVTSDSEDILLNPGSCIAYYLEENPGEEDAEREPVVFVEGDQGDPPEDDDGEPNFSFDHLSLNTQLRFVRNTTVRESLLLKLAMAWRYNWTYEALICSMISENVMLGAKLLPHSKPLLWKIIGRNRAGIVKHAYCNKCTHYLGKHKGLPDVVHCQCGFRIAKSKVKFFVSLSLRAQLQQFLAYPGVADMLQYRTRREQEKRNETDIADIYDGREYKRLRAEGGPLAVETNYSYVMNTDGFRIGNSATLEAWPIYARINELPPSLRQKFRFLIGVWIGKTPPDMKTFLTPFVEQANSLSRNPVVWKPNGVDERQSLFVPTCFCVDSKARCTLLNMKQFNGFYGCTFCDHIGVSVGSGPVKYPILPHPEVPEPVIRTDASIRADMRIAGQTGIEQHGVFGPSPLMNLNHFDLGKGNAVDDLHPLYERVTATHLELLLNSEPPRLQPPMRPLRKQQRLDLMDRRLMAIKTPSSIARKPSSLKHRDQWKGTEWRNYLIYYSVPCMEGYFSQADCNHVELLSYAAFLLSQDVITPEELDVAEECIRKFVTIHEERHGLDSMTFSLHLLLHIVESIRDWGPFWSYSTFNFESWNMKLKDLITSAFGAIDQIVMRHLLYFAVRLGMTRDYVSDRVKDQLSLILDARRRVGAREVGRVQVYGKVGESREPTELESNLLQREEYACRSLTQFKSLYISRTTYHPVEYQNQDQLSDDSLVYTWDNTFGIIKCIVVLENDQEICGLFIEELDVECPFTYAKHVALLQPYGEHPLHFIPVSKVRNPAVKVISSHKTYVIPVANQFEID